MAQHEVASHEAVETHGALEVDLVPRRQLAERGPGERLGSDIEADAVTGELHGRQADTVDGEARADLGAVERQAGADHEPSLAAPQHPAGFLDDACEHLSVPLSGACRFREERRPPPSSRSPPGGPRRSRHGSLPAAAGPPLRWAWAQ